MVSTGKEGLGLQAEAPEPRENRAKQQVPNSALNPLSRSQRKL
jgi:hypothetical protein